MTKRSQELGRTPFMAREDGAYHVLEMPKRLRCSYTARRTRRSHLLVDKASHGDEEEDKKRAAEPEEEDPELESAEPDGDAYGVYEMTKKFRGEFTVDPRDSPRVSALFAHEAKEIARTLRLTSIYGPR